jgi:hypothetical protein
MGEGEMSSDRGWDGPAVRNELMLQRQRQHVFAGRLPAFDPYMGALVSGCAVQFTVADGTRWVLDEANVVREWDPADAGLPGAGL